MRHGVKRRSFSSLHTSDSWKKYSSFHGPGAADQEGRRIGRAGLAEELRGVAVQRHVGHRVLPARVAVHDHAEVVFEVAAFGRHAHAALARRVGHPLPLIAPRLHVLLDRDRAPCLQARDVLFGDLGSW